MKHLVIGLGQIGTAIKNVLRCDGCDIEGTTGDYDVIHICYPYFNGFEKSVKDNQEKYGASYVVIHSTVPVGTSRKCGAVHSPVRGRHPNLTGGVETFVKFFGGEDARIVAGAFVDKGIRIALTDKPENTEAMKLWDTTQYGWNIVLEKIIHKYCKDNGLDFDIVYTRANQTYNEGYAKLGNPEYCKYVLKHMEGRCGGHCVIQNLPLLGGEVAEFIKKFDDDTVL